MKKGSQKGMDAMIKIGTESAKADILTVEKAITSILQVGFDSHAEQDTIQVALNVLKDTAGIKNVMITNPVEPEFVKASNGDRYAPYHMKTGGKSAKTKQLRSITPPHFAKAFYEVNK